MTSPIQESFESFSNLKFDPFKSKNVFSEDSNDPDKIFYYNIHVVDMQYNFPSELLSLYEKLHINSENFSMIRLNMRSTEKIYEKIKDFLSQTGSFFKALCLSESCFDNRNSESWLYQLPQYTAIH